MRLPRSTIRASSEKATTSMPIERTIRLAFSSLPSGARRNAARLLAALAAVVVLGGCVYRLDIQQGNVVGEDDIAQVEVGMTRSQVQFLLGTPMVSDTFHEDRWDYPYYLRQGHHRNPQQRWFVVYFQNDRVVRVERNVEPTQAARSESSSRTS
jgi:outer membrane protein assembly factor BamE